MIRITTPIEDLFFGDASPVGDDIEWAVALEANGLVLSYLRAVPAP